jgi:hypothetical protein
MKEGSWICPHIGNPHHKQQGSSSVGGVHAAIRLAAPTRVAPAPTAEQKQDYKNNQYGRHGVPH